jgi:uncharacterized membrane protein (DUF4010 family)
MIRDVNLRSVSVLSTNFSIDAFTVGSVALTATTTNNNKRAEACRN